MNILIGVLLVAWGLGLMAFGLWLFYALLPLWYGLFGAMAGFAIGAMITSGGWVGNVLAWTLAILGAALFAGMSYKLEPYRRIVIGLLMGFSLGAALAGLFGGGVFFTALFGGIGAVIFAILVPLYFDPMIVVGSSFSGAALVMDGALLILPFLAFLLDRSGAATAGRFLPIVVYIVLGAVGMGWQLVNLKKWAGVASLIPVKH